MLTAFAGVKVNNDQPELEHIGVKVSTNKTDALPKKIEHTVPAFLQLFPKPA